MKDLVILCLCFALIFSKKVKFGDFPYDPELKYKAAPAEYLKPCTGCQGKITTETYYGTYGTNHLQVYTPYGYDATKEHNIFYFMHGLGDDYDKIFGPDVNMQNIFDHLIKDKVMEPMIIVAPSWNNCGAQSFYVEWLDDVIPLVEKKYKTYAKDTSREGIKGSRRHRAFGGFSMGGICTWSTFQHALQYATYYMPISGDNEEALFPEDKAQGLVNAILDSGLSRRDYFIMSACGGLDFMYPALGPQIEAMKNHEEFIFTSNFAVGNTWFVYADYGSHDWSYVKDYVCEMLPYFFHE